MTDTPDSSSRSSTYEGYVMDAENAAEMARLMVQDHLLTQVMGGILPEQTDLSQIQQVLDIACGPGGWLLNLATEHPHMRGTGIDISQLMIDYANSQTTQQGLSNAHFEVMDATKPLAFPDQTFDLINGRIFIGFLSRQQWPALLSECTRILKPGGILRLTEAEWAFTNSVACDRLTGFCALALSRAGYSFSPNGRTFGNTPILRSLMQQAGCEVMGHRAHAVDYSAGAPQHESNTQNMLVAYKQMQSFCVQMGLATQEELDRLYEQMEADMLAKDFCAIDYLLTVWGRKRD